MKTKELIELSDEDALEASKLLGGASHLSDNGQIFQAKELLTTNKFFNHQTNIPGIKWWRALKYLESKGYKIDKYEDAAPQS
jgi:hypothetical protein